MLDFFARLLVADFMPHVYCLREPGVIWLHVISDGLIALAYGLIPAALVLLIRRRRDLEFSWMFSLFGLFILSCGATHVLAIWTVWHPVFRLEGLVKAITAMASIPTAILLVRLVPEAVALPSPRQLRELNRDLKKEMLERRRAEQNLLLLNQSLEERIVERTEEIRATALRLKESEERHRLATDAANMGVWYWDLATDELSWDARTRVLHGVGPDESVSFKRILGTIHPDDRDLVTSAVERSIECGAEFNAEYRVIWPGGSNHWIVSKGQATASTNGRPLRMLGVVTDITQQVAARQALVNSEARLSAYLESASQGIVALDRDGSIELVNRKILEMFGYRREELQGEAFEILLPELHRSRYRDQLVESFERPAARRVALTQEMAGLSKNGDEFPIEIAMGLVETSSAGTAIALITDTTERTRAAENLRKAHDELATLVETCPLGIFTVDTNGCVTGWNASAERIFHFTRDEVARCLPPVVPEGEMDDYRSLVQSIRNGASVSNRERIYQTKEKAPVPVAIWASALRQPDGGIRSGVIVVADLTDRKALQQQLAQSQRMEAVGRLAGGIAHDFNNMLTAIIGYNELLVTAAAEHPRLLDYATGITDAAKRACDLTGQLLAFSRRQAVQPQVVDLNKVVGKVEKLLKRLIPEEVEVQFDLAPLPVRVKVDPTQMDLVVINLAVNARDAMPQGGKLVIGTGIHESRTRGDKGSRSTEVYGVLSVTDNGVGMDPVTKDHLFEPFFTTKQLGKGTGLGLSIVYGIVQQHGGEIQVVSEPGAGATFRILFPAVAGGTDSSETAEPVLKAVAGMGKILLVEDEPIVRNLLTAALRQLGYEVVEASAPHEAIRLAHEHRGTIRLLLTDVIMPKMRGPELAKIIRREYPETKIVFMSGYSDSSFAGDVLGSAAYLQKPFTSGTLAAKLEEVFAEESAD